MTRARRVDRLVRRTRCPPRWLAAQNSDCAICVRVCPSNKDFSKWWLRLGRRLAGTPLRRLMLWLDVRLGYGEPEHHRHEQRCRVAAQLAEAVARDAATAMTSTSNAELFSA